VVGDLHARLGHAAEAEQHYARAEALEREGWASEEPQPQALARFLAERDRNIAGAVQLAEEAAGKRRDIYTMDGLAWSYFKAGRTDQARRASEAALRTGTRDPRILYHGAAIRAAQGDSSGARALLDRIPAPALDLDPIVSPLTRALASDVNSAETKSSTHARS